MRFNVVVLVLSFLGMMGASHTASAQEYILEPGDVVAISFWQVPDLNVPAARIDTEGKINIPLAGRVNAAGLTVSQLSGKVVERISIYNKSITQAAVTVTEYGSKKIFITGAVGKPGKYSFEKMPTIWEAILEAGGPLPTALLSNVQLIRGGKESGKIISIDLSAAFERNDMRGLPVLLAGDNVYVLSSQASGAGSTSGAFGDAPAASGLSGMFTNTKAVYVFGQVVAPGVYQIDKDVDVLQMIVRAGGPAYPNRFNTNGPITEPDLAHVKIISRGFDAPVVYSVNVEKYTNTAAPIPLLLKPGDTVFIPGKQSYRRFFLISSTTQVIQASAAVITSYLLLNQLFGQGKQSNQGN